MISKLLLGGGTISLSTVAFPLAIIYYPVNEDNTEVQTPSPKITEELKTLPEEKEDNTEVQTPAPKITEEIKTIPEKKEPVINKKKINLGALVRALEKLKNGIETPK